MIRNPLWILIPIGLYLWATSGQPGYLALVILGIDRTMRVIPRWGEVWKSPVPGGVRPWIFFPLGVLYWVASGNPANLSLVVLGFLRAESWGWEGKGRRDAASLRKSRGLAKAKGAAEPRIPVEETLKGDPLDDPDDEAGVI